jgi:hypothetical protein
MAPEAQNIVCTNINETICVAHRAMPNFMQKLIVNFCGEFGENYGKEAHAFCCH